MDFGTLTLYRKGEQPQPIRLRLGSLSIGSDPAADISVEDGTLERFHARVVCTPAGCQLTDLGSKGGTLVNRERLQPHRPRLLRDGDRIQMGRIGLIYAAPQPASAVPDTPAPTTAPAPDATPAEPSGRMLPPEAPVAPGIPVRTASATGAITTPLRATPEPTPTPEPAPARRPAETAPAASPVPAMGDEWDALFTAPIVPAGGSGATVLPSNRRRRRPDRDLPYAADDYLALLPPIYHDDLFLRKFLLIFKATLDPLDRMIAQIHHYFDPRVAPEHMLPWLAAWVDLVLDERWPEARRRELIGAASTLYRWRGTRRGLSDYLRIYTGTAPRIVEPGQERRGEAALPPHTFRVIIEAPDIAALDRALVERIIELEKPAHTSYQLELRATG
ncbi:MAG: hypothetical protein OHK0015_47600 [Chloroflexi bacterium OHK40]